MTSRGVLGRAFRRAADWRLLLLFVLGMAIPSVAALMPIGSLLGGWMDLHPQAAAWARALDSMALTDISKQLASPRATTAIGASASAAGFLTLLVAPLLAGFALAAARTGPLKLRGLLSDGAGYYGRLLRFVPCSLIPLGAFGGAGAMLFTVAGKYAQKALTEHAATTASRAATGGFIFLLLLGQTIADCGRALFVAEPARRSAFFAAFAGFKLFFRRPLRAFFLVATTWVAALLSAALILALRLRIAQHGAATLLLALALAQIAVAALGWGRTARLLALVGLAEANGAARQQRLAEKAEKNRQNMVVVVAPVSPPEAAAAEPVPEKTAEPAVEEPTPLPKNAPAEPDKDS